MGQYETNSNNRGWVMRIDTNGDVTFLMSPDGTSTANMFFKHSWGVGDIIADDGSLHYMQFYHEDGVGAGIAALHNSWSTAR